MTRSRSAHTDAEPTTPAATGFRRALLVVVVLFACAPAGPGGAGGGAGAGGAAEPVIRSRSRAGIPMRREDRVVLGRFSDVSAIAVSRRLVFMSTPQGLGIYDRLFDGWLPPLTPDQGFPSDPITAFAADPANDGVWIGSPGAVLYYQPAIDMLVRTSLPGSVDAILFDARDPGGGAFVRAGGQWTRVSPTGFVTTLAGFGDLPPNASRLVPPTLQSVYRQYPALQGFAPLLTRDAQLRSWPVTAAAEVPERQEVWLGTYGDGMFKVDPIFNQATHYPFGLLDRGVGAIALAADGIWAAGLGTAEAQRGGLTFVSDNFQQWQWLEGPISLPLRATRVNRLEVRGARAWIATDRGLFIMNTRDETDLAQLSSLNGLPADQVLSVAARDDGAWVGTARGLVFVQDTAGRQLASRVSVGPILASGTAVRALLLTGDTLWIGSDAGLLFLPPGSDQAPVRASAAIAEPRLARPIVALARSDTVVAVANTDEVLRFNVHTGQLMPRLANGAMDFGGIGQITAMRMDAHTLWVGGPSGVLVISRSNEVARLLTIPADLPGAVYDLQLQDEYAWVGTRWGLVRLRRLNDGTVP
jgi:hypothetical protein